ncbi:type VII secretion protein EccB [Catenulispora rubra]|uniref:type VII secretion protein EccB n=1 Tax=Catenulispora rubra TaxID=280293 RepID=UPI0018927D5D|nr:type VII secretion protein EccB [Catenulispora rubra]
MTSRRDQLQSYQFLVHRTISAFVMRQTDPVASPLRRGVGAMFAGAMAAVLAAAGFGVYGLLTKSGPADTRTEGTVVVEKETGADYVFLGGLLHPVLNYASALLAAGAAGKETPSVSVVSGTTLAGVPLGSTIGIAGAPASLPAAGRAVGMPWTACSAPAGSSTTAAGPTSGSASAPNPVAGQRILTVFVGAAPAAGAVLGAGQALLVTDPAGAQEFLLWHGHRYTVQKPQVVVPALFGALVTATPVSAAWLNTVPAGTDIAPIGVLGQGADSPAVPGRRIGDLLVAATAAGPQYYLVRSDGLEPITALQKDILLAQLPGQPSAVGLADIADLPRSVAAGPGAEPTDPPQNPPALVTPAATDPVCALWRDAHSAPSLTIASLPAGAEAAVPTGPSAMGTGVADRILVPSGHVAVVRALPSPDATAGAYYIVTDIGVRYLAPSDAVLKTLGYDATSAVDVPAQLLTLIPAGPALDPTAAVQPVQVAQAGGS